MRVLFIILSSIVFMGCVTGYGPVGWKGGYSDQKLNKDLYEVSFEGNGYTNKTLVNNYFLKRCAEITTNEGYDYFAMVDQSAEANITDMGTYYSGSISPNGYGGYNQSGHAQNQSVTRHIRTGVIKLFKEGSQPNISYSAKELASR